MLNCENVRLRICCDPIQISLQTEAPLESGSLINTYYLFGIKAFALVLLCAHIYSSYFRPYATDVSVRWLRKKKIKCVRVVWQTWIFLHHFPFNMLLLQSCLLELYARWAQHFNIVAGIVHMVAFNRAATLPFLYILQTFYVHRLHGQRICFDFCLRFFIVQINLMIEWKLLGYTFSQCYIHFSIIFAEQREKNRSGILISKVSFPGFLYIQFLLSDVINRVCLIHRMMSIHNRRSI